MSLFYAIVTAFGLLCVVDLIICLMALRHRTSEGLFLGLTCAGALMATFSYSCSLFLQRYFPYSLFSSLYFASVDFTLVSLVFYTWYFTRERPVTARYHLWQKLILSFAAADILLLMINPFREIVIHYEPITADFSRYAYQMKPLYLMHLAFTYFLICLSLTYMIRRIVQTPRIYRRRYIYAVLAIVVSVLINLIYLISNHVTAFNLDYSLIGYSLGALLLYWNSFQYSGKGQLNHFHSWVFEHVEQGLLLFDYNDQLILKNRQAAALLPELSCQDMNFRAFLSLCQVASGPWIDSDQRTFQFYLEGAPVRCDYSVQRDKKNRVLGRLFVLCPMSTQFDLLTGFRSWESFKACAEELFDKEEQPVVAAFDINSLSDINRAYSHKIGDQMIHILAQEIRRHFPEGTVFVRGREAMLFAIRRDTTQEQMYLYAETALHDAVNREDLPVRATVQTSIGACAPGEHVVDTLRETIQTLRTKKLMDRSSVHSDVLNSLIQALEQCDNQTRDHVYRTQQTCAELGRRLGLSDSQQSNLALLAVLHDIGKIGIPLEILNKPGKLTQAEWEMLKTHVQKGYRIARSSQDLSRIADMILYHHERWDGHGYPVGLKGDRIPLLSRIISVVDSYDAMTNDRPYHKALSESQARAELRAFAGSQFDPDLVAEFLKMKEETDKEAGVSLEPADRAETEAAAHSANPTVQRSAENLLSPLSSHVHGMSTGRYILDAHMRIMSISPEFTAITGYTQKDVEEKRLSQMDLIFPEDAPEYGQEVRKQVNKQNYALIVHRIRRRDGSAASVFCFGRDYYDSALLEERTEVLITDITAGVALPTHVITDGAVMAARQTLHRDSLTGLLNRETFRQEVFRRMLDGGTRAMMLLMDVNNFTAYNETHGRNAADMCLIGVAQALADTLREGDLLCRLEGDSFAAMLFYSPDLSEETMLRRGRQICDRVNLAMASESDPLSVSMGAAFMNEQHDSFDEICSAAFEALRKTKSAH